MRLIKALIHRGLTRIVALKKAGKKKVMAEVFTGLNAPSLLWAIHMNRYHGSPLNLNHLRDALNKYFDNEAGVQLKDQDIAFICGIRIQNVRHFRKFYNQYETSNKSQQLARPGRQIMPHIAPWNRDMHVASILQELNRAFDRTTSAIPRSIMEPFTRLEYILMEFSSMAYNVDMEFPVPTPMSPKILNAMQYSDLVIKQKYPRPKKNNSRPKKSK